MKNELIKTYKNILNIKKELITNYMLGTLTEEKILDLYRNYIKEYIKLTTNKPNYILDLDNYSGCNCYSYALGINTPIDFQNFYHLYSDDNIILDDGFISNKQPGYTTSKIIDNILSDLDTLNIQIYETSINEQNKHNGYKIAILLNDIDLDFHFIRQNNNGKWSEKLGTSDLIQELPSPKESNYLQDDNYHLYSVCEIVKPTLKK